MVGPGDWRLRDALGAALYEDLFTTTTAVYLPGASRIICCTDHDEVPALILFRVASPFTPLGAKGVAEGNCMSTPVCIANAVADALGVAELDLPLTPPRVLRLLAASQHRPQA